MSASPQPDGRVLIVGQGLAGTALGLELEAAGVPFVIASDGHARAASRAAAGLVNPIAGQRFVKAWRVDELLPEAERWYRAAGVKLGVDLWHSLRLRRLFANATEAARAARKLERGELAPYASACDGGVEIHGAAWVDLPALLACAERRWRESGVLREASVARDELRVGAQGAAWRGEEFSAVVLCTGAGELAREWFAELPFEAAKGEILHVRGAELAADEAVSRGTWVLPESGQGARIGATYERGVEELSSSAAARETLLAAARGLVRGELRVIDQRVGVRVSLPDRLPAVGWRGGECVGFFGALGSKGTLCAPWLARRWSEVLRGVGADWPGEVSVGRAVRRGRVAE